MGELSIPRLKVLAMSKRYVMIADGPTPEQQNIITRALKPYGYWHHYAHSWVIQDTSNDNVTVLRDLIHEKVPDLQFMIFQIDSPNAWAGWGVASNYDWFKSSWSDDKLLK
jgi:hypothetical protein